MTDEDTIAKVRASQHYYAWKAVMEAAELRLASLKYGDSPEATAAYDALRLAMANMIGWASRCR